MEKTKLDFSASVSPPWGERLKRIPGVFGIRFGEKPEYQVLVSYADKEIRRYGPLTMASVTMCGENYDEAKRAAYNCLVNYIFGKNVSEQVLPQTGILVQQEVMAKSNGMVLQKQNLKRLMVSLILPYKYNLVMVPEPMDKRIILHEKPGHLVGVLQYSGMNASKKVEKLREGLNEWLNQNEIYYPTAEMYLFEYDNPLTLPFLRKNEIHIEVAERH